MIHEVLLLCLRCVQTSAVEVKLGRKADESETNHFLKPNYGVIE